VRVVDVLDEELDDDMLLSAGRAAPGANSGTVLVLAVARVAARVESSAKFSFDPLACNPVARS
jgi:hypothetical protein